MPEDSILNTIKKMLGMPASYSAFDEDVMVFINSAFSDLNSLGVGPDSAFTIKDSEGKWADFMGAKTDIENVKTYVYLSARIIFDPPTNTSVLEAYKERKAETQFRLQVASEKVSNA